MQNSLCSLKSWKSSTSSLDEPGRKDKDLSSLAVPRLADGQAEPEPPGREWPKASWLSKALIRKLVANSSVSRSLKNEWLGPQTHSQWKGGIYQSQVIYWAWKVSSSTTAGRKHTVRNWASVQWHDPMTDDLRTVCTCTCAGYRNGKIAGASSEWHPSPSRTRPLHEGCV